MLYRIVFLSGVFYATTLKSDFIEDVKERELIEMDTFLQEGTPLMLIKADSKEELQGVIEDMGITGTLQFV